MKEFVVHGPFFFLLSRIKSSSAVQWRAGAIRRATSTPGTQCPVSVLLFGAENRTKKEIKF